MNEFKRGRTPEIIKKVHDMILNHRRVKVREIVEAVGISHGTVITILHEELSMKKPSARWVPRLLTVENKRNRVKLGSIFTRLRQRNSRNSEHHQANQTRRRQRR